MCQLKKVCKLDERFLAGVRSRVDFRWLRLPLQHRAKCAGSRRLRLRLRTHGHVAISGHPKYDRFQQYNQSDVFVGDEKASGCMRTPSMTCVKFMTYESVFTSKLKAMGSFIFEIKRSVLVRTWMGASSMARGKYLADRQTRNLNLIGPAILKI